jgi:hypothetical protein
MVGVQVAFVLPEALPEFLQHLFGRRWPEFELPEVDYYVRLPPAVDASPTIANEAKNPKAPVHRVVPALFRSASNFVLLPTDRPFVLRAVSRFAQCATSGLATRNKREIHSSTKPCCGERARAPTLALASDSDFVSDSDSALASDCARAREACD